MSFQRPIQLPGQFSQCDGSAPGQLVVQTPKPLEEIEGQYQNQQPGHDGNRMVVRTVFQVIVLGHFVEDAVLDAPARMADAPDALGRYSVQFPADQPAPKALLSQGDFAAAAQSSRFTSVVPASC